VNKDDTKVTQENKHEFMRLGFGEAVCISAQHGTGINSMLDAVIAYFGNIEKKVAQEKPAFRVTLLGKPNVGKSSLMNALLQQERSIVSDIPGTTREALTETISFYKEMIALTDTAGIRRQKSVTGDLEPIMVKSSFHALKESDVIVLVIDVTEAQLADQELKLAFYAFAEHYKALIIVFNKTDLMTERMREDLARNLDFYKHLMKKVPVLEVSCKTGKNIGKLLPLVKDVWQRYSQWLSNEEINRLFIAELGRRPLLHQGKLLNVHAVRQVSTAPITIGMAVNEIDWFGPSQLAFFENLLRAEYKLQGVPVRFSLRKKFGNKKPEKTDQSS
jgi:GTP-binding protein